MSERVEAAGGVVLRVRGGRLEVALVHRPRWRDWSLPKGKLAPGEGFEQAALREIEEETGYRCELEGELEPASYTDHRGRQKLVRWFRMRPLGGSFEPTDEVDELRWLPLAEAIELLDYEHDRRLLRALG